LRRLSVRHQQRSVRYKPTDRCIFLNAEIPAIAAADSADAPFDIPPRAFI
jgi:hypothetical protein